MGRPAVSVVVPFLGGEAEAAAMLAGLERLRLGPGDELIVADNTPRGVVAGVGEARVVRAPARRSAFHARNAGAAVAAGSWLLFTDADCVPPADLLDRLADPEPGERCAIVAGEARGADDQAALLARWARSRRGPIASHQLDLGPRPGRDDGEPARPPGGVRVRRRLLRGAVGRGRRALLADPGAGLGARLPARGRGRPPRPERLGDVLRQAAGYGAGRRWLRSSYGPAVPEPALARPLARAAGGALVWTLTLRLERAAFKLVDGAVAAASWWGYRFGDNRARRA